MILALPVSLDFVSKGGKKLQFLCGIGNKNPKFYTCFLNSCIEMGLKVPTLPVITVLVPNWKQKSKVYLILNSCIGLGLKVPTLPVSIVLVPDWE